jgi:2-keto-4-pentenoate hydratase/2-oxohepta-3-ene-1,7-dioic acid hydratase in catechol pathway
VLLHDYEVELGFVLLEDVDLHDLPRNYDAFIDRVAFFVANDVSDREPIVLDPKTGYTLGKTRPGYLPIGPWMVHGRYLRPRAGSEGDRVLRLGLEVYEAAGSPPQTQRRQLAGTDQMLRGPWAIVGHMSRVLRQGRIICMRDAYGEQRFVHDANGRIPAGSIILTGTPGGTAIHEPRLIDKGALFVRGGFSPAGARRTYILDMERDAAAMGFLQTGDEVESWIDGLGRQRWEVVASERDAPYGTAGSRACEPGARPQPVGGR